MRAAFERAHQRYGGLNHVGQWRSDPPLSSRSHLPRSSYHYRPSDSSSFESTSKGWVGRLIMCIVGLGMVLLAAYWAYTRYTAQPFDPLMHIQNTWFRMRSLTCPRTCLTRDVQSASPVTQRHPVLDSQREWKQIEVGDTKRTILPATPMEELATNTKTVDLISEVAPPLPPPTTSTTSTIDEAPTRQPTELETGDPTIVSGARGPTWLARWTW